MNTRVAKAGWAALLCVLLSCADEAPSIDQVQENLVDKAIFEGEWWYSSTTIDVDYDKAKIFASAGGIAPFEGSMSTDYGIDFNRSGPYVIGSPTYSFPIARIRWVIDEGYLFAYRSFELVQGGNDDGRSPDYRGQPLAVFAIEDHVDVRQDYNPVTGEETNVRIENTSDRRWYERKFMRVDWSENLITQFAANDAQANDVFQAFQRESTPLLVKEGTPGFSEAYKPKFERVQDEADYRFASEWPKEESDKVHYMSFVTQEVWSPGATCVQSQGICAAATVTLRNAFLRVPPNHDYAVNAITNREFDRFGIFRSHQPNYARGGQDKETLHDFCIADDDCGEGGACDLERNICVGGLTSDRGESDFLSYFASRQNPYKQSLTDTECVADWECDGRHLTCEGTDEGKDRDECETTLRAMHGSSCDPAARRCTIPLREREIRPLEYRLSKHFPPYLVRSTFDSVGQWNEALMRGARAAKGLLPINQVACDEDAEQSGEGRYQRKGDGLCTADLGAEGAIDCQEENPAAFCFCGSPEDQNGVCHRAYDPFEPPDVARKRGVPNPYDCYIEGPSDVAHPQDYADYDATSYQYRFVGSECVLKLTANSCDTDEETPCEELGDLRYQFITHLQHGAAGFGGVAQPLSDPTTGELVVSNATVAAESLESVGTIASQFFPVLRGEVPEDRYFSGETLRGYYARLGYVHHPVSLASSGTDGYSVDDPGRPTNSQAGDVLEDLKDRMAQLEPRMEQLRGQDGRVAIFSDRLQALRGTDLAARFDAALSNETGAGLPLVTDDNVVAVANGALPSPGAQGKPMSLIDHSPLDQVLADRTRAQAREARNIDDFEAKLYNSQYWDYWAAALAGRPLEEAALRLQQVYYRGVMTHEVGHALGLRHNFAGSLDRDHYPDAYFKLARQLPLPSNGDYDTPDLGGNNDGKVTGAEVDRFAKDLRDARLERLKAGAGNVMSASVMDYDGDMSSFSGMGRYDAAAVMFSYFNLVEAFAVTDAQSRIDWDAIEGQGIDSAALQSLGPLVDPDRPTSLVDGASSLAGISYSDVYPRELWNYYRGGETCSNDAECPFSAGRETTAYQLITQRCVSNTRTPNTTGDCADGGCLCSSFYDDFAQYQAGLAYRAETSPVEYTPVRYLYCHDNRVNDLSWCTRNDAGESFQETIDHYRLGWLQRYPQAYFRNYRAAGPSRGYSQQSVVEAVKIYQHLFFRYNNEGNAFRQSRGPLGFNDQLLASADAMNWLAEIIASPDVGSYKLDLNGVYRQISKEPGAPDADFSLDPGQGFYLWSAYQAGQNGFFRLERAGTFLDKLLAIEAMARRDWGLSFTIDERYYINFYDLFPSEVIDIFGGMILRNPKAYAPRVSMDGDQPVVSYLDNYRGCIIGPTGCVRRGNNQQTYSAPAIDGSDTEVLRDAAAIQALATFPIFYDTSFEQRLLVFKNGSGDGYKLPETRQDGTPICAYGEDGCDAPDYIVYDSDRLHTSYVAVVIQPEGEGSVDEQQLGFQLLLRLRQTQDAIRELKANDDRSAAQDELLKTMQQDLERDETFIDYLIELGHAYGISTYLF